VGRVHIPPDADDGAAGNPAEVGLPQVGSVLGAYRVVSRVGSGGMAVIYRAEHVRLRREVALKVLRPTLASRPASLRRFIEEARAVNEIGHPNIVDIIDILEDYTADPPLVYMVMELLSGEDLHARIAREGALSVRDALHIASQIADALTATHGENILHRDLKPSNVFLARINGKATVKLLDFGLLKHFGDRPARQLTKPEVVPGTPLYMSPEQIMGGVLDQRTDVYGFGLVVYEMLASLPPFAGKQDTEVLVLHAKEPAPELSDRRPDLDPKLAQAVMKCLKKDPAERYPTVAAARDGLLQAANLPLSLSRSSRTASLLVPVVATFSRRRVWLPVVGALLVLLTFAGVFAWRLIGSSSRGEVSEVRDAVVHAYRASGATSRRWWRGRRVLLAPDWL
jgi:serine/threonine protein kinase